MRTFTLGTDNGNAMFKVLVLIMILSTVLISFVGRIKAVEQYAGKYKAEVLLGIEQSNREIINRYEFH